jgi:hypothetical protein
VRRALLALCVCACGHKPAPGESIAEVCRVENSDKDVVVSGYLVAPAVAIPCETSCALVLGTKAGEREGGILVFFPAGTGPNRIAPIRFEDSPSMPGEVVEVSPSAFVVTDDAGKDLGLGDIVRISGHLAAHDSGGRIDCSMRATKLTQAVR